MIALVYANELPDVIVRNATRGSVTMQAAGHPQVESQSQELIRLDSCLPDAIKSTCGFLSPKMQNCSTFNQALFNGSLRHLVVGACTIARCVRRGGALGSSLAVSGWPDLPYGPACS